MQERHGVLFLLVIVGLVLTWIVMPALAEETQPSEDKVALVNGSVVSRVTFDREMSGVRQRFSSMGKPISPSQLQELEKKVLDNLINIELLYQQSRKVGTKVDEAEVSAQLETLKKRFPTEAEFKNAINKMKLTETVMKSQIRRGITIQRFLDKKTLGKVEVTEEEIKAYYDSHTNFFKKPGQVRASHILIKVEPGANEKDKAKAREKIEKIRKRLVKGEDFGALAREFSQCPSSAKGGDLNYFGRRQMAKPFEDAAFALKVGELSDVVETRFGYHLIKVTDKKPASTYSYKDVKNRIRKNLVREKTRIEVSNYVQKLKKAAKIEIFPVKDAK
ncbi:MAG: peptidylprolyl isomerase [Candidatus Desulfofervidaceae bacterium]|nr:peptidylprolyl isomerase [Candidatus Desulfofervidaceae bacterium]